MSSVTGSSNEAAIGLKVSLLSLEVSPVEASVTQQFRSCGCPILNSVTPHFHDTVLVLHGTLPSYYLKQLAQEFAMHIDGVQQVVNNIQVCIPSAMNNGPENCDDGALF